MLNFQKVRVIPTALQGAPWGPFDAYTDGTRTPDGFLVVLFTKRTAQLIMERLAKTLPECEPAFDQDRDAFTLHDADGMEYTFTGRNITVKRRLLHVYPIGDGEQSAWAWEIQSSETRTAGA